MQYKIAIKFFLNPIFSAFKKVIFFQLSFGVLRNEDSPTWGIKPWAVWPLIIKPKIKILKINRGKTLSTP